MTLSTRAVLLDCILASLSTNQAALDQIELAEVSQAVAMRDELRACIGVVNSIENALLNGEEFVDVRYDAHFDPLDPELYALHAAAHARGAERAASVIAAARVFGLDVVWLDDEESLQVAEMDGSDFDPVRLGDVRHAG